MPYVGARLFRGGLFANCAERDPKHDVFIETTRVRSGLLGTPSCEFDQSSKEGAPPLRVLSEDGDLDFETDVRAKN
jgi:hypothetical protein